MTSAILLSILLEDNCSATAASKSLTRAMNVQQKCGPSSNIPSIGTYQSPLSRAVSELLHRRLNLTQAFLQSTELLDSTAYLLNREIMSKRARRTTSVHGPLHRRGHKRSVNPNTRGEVHGPIDTFDELCAFLEFLAHVRHDVRDIPYVRVYNARGNS